MAGMMGQRSSGVPAERTSLFPIGSLRREMEDLVENFFGGMTLTGQPGSYLPSIDVSETSDAVHVSTDLPGMKAEEVQIDVRDNVVTISGSNSEETDLQTKSDRKYHRIERRKGSFSRSVSLPCDVDSHSADAVLKDGVLHLTLKKTKPEKPQKITIRT